MSQAISTVLFLAVVATPTWADALTKLKPDKLEATHKAIAAFRSQRQPQPRHGPYQDYRANLHVHSALSHDSRGTVAEIVAAATKVGTSVLMFTEHPSERYDYFVDGHRGMRDGVLLIPGAETNGFLCFPTRSMRGLKTSSPQEFSDLIRSRGGLTFLSHVEERMDWKVRGMTGMEIYNTHADFKDEKNLLAAMRNPLWIFQSAALFRKYPQEAFSALQDYPGDYLRRWDQLSALASLTGIAANDSHQNVGLVVKLLDGGKVRIEDPLSQKLLELESTANPLLQMLSKGKRPGDILFQAQLDPYENSLRHVGTHLLLRELSEKAVREALEAGRAFVAFDWLADATGFDFAAILGDKRHEMGGRVTLAPGLKLQARGPLPVRWKVLRNGNLSAETQGRSIDLAVSEPGTYRVEAWLNVVGEEMIWILSNAIYIR
jgi:hypothetical protein